MTTKLQVLGRLFKYKWFPLYVLMLNFEIPHRAPLPVLSKGCHGTLWSNRILYKMEFQGYKLFVQAYILFYLVSCLKNWTIAVEKRKEVEYVKRFRTEGWLTWTNLHAVCPSVPNIDLSRYNIKVMFINYQRYYAIDENILLKISS